MGPLNHSGSTERYDRILGRIPTHEHAAAVAKVLSDMEHAGEHFTRPRFLERLDAYAAAVGMRGGDANS
ncbi:MAG: hypothetical protein WD960_14910 [Gemmatimonadota bacterium]